MTRVEELESVVAKHLDVYTNGAPTITDAEYDSLVDELRQLAPNSLILDRVGALPSYGKKVVHPVPMGSLEKTTTVGGLQEWAKKHTSSTQLIVTPKIDGLAVRLVYENGHLELAATRGDGNIGQDVTDNIRACKTIPQVIRGFSGEVRGEIYMPRSVFRKLREQGVAFANPRNAAAGSLMAKDPAITEGRDLHLFVYDWEPHVALALWRSREEDKLVCIRQATHLDVVEWGCFLLKDISTAINLWAERRSTLDYEIDGLVFALGSLDDQSKAGSIGLRPRGKLAFKFPPEQAQSKVIGIDAQVGRTGKITPMLRIVPTVVAGSMIQNITMHNVKWYRELAVSVSDTVLIEKAGDIIPQVVRVVERGGSPPIWFDRCPSCESPLSFDGVNGWCLNQAGCKTQLIASLLHFVTVLGMDGIGEGILVALYEAAVVRQISDLYRVTVSEVASAIGSEVVADKIMVAITKARCVPLAKFLEALGIDGLGAGTAKDIAKRYKSLVEVIRLIETSRWEDLASIEGIGTVTALKIGRGLTDRLDMINHLRLNCVTVEKVVEKSGELSGLTFVVTGALSRPRKEIEKLITENGGEVKGSVGKSLSFLVVGTDAGSKLAQAQKYGVKTITEQELLAML